MNGQQLMEARCRAIIQALTQMLGEQLMLVRCPTTYPSPDPKLNGETNVGALSAKQPPLLPQVDHMQVSGHNYEQYY